jgi:hypothetical protein
VKVSEARPMKFLNALPPISYRSKKIDNFIQLNVQGGGEEECIQDIGGKARRIPPISYMHFH